jgi:hypothetical protein
MTDKLKSCPFCGSDSLKIESCYVRCQSCCADGPVMDGVPEGSEDDESGEIWNNSIAALWNTRNGDHDDR